MVALASCAPERGLLLATTTSTYDSGILSYLLPPFEEKTGIRVEVVAVGSGQALALGDRGDADVLLVHSPQAEEAFMAKGLGAVRRRVMYNDFVLVGPPSDPAGIRGMKDAAQALARIANRGAPFVSRGDDSGTHAKEKSLWQGAGLTPGGGWYLPAGQGMGETLNLAREKMAYTLSDRATFLSQKKPGLEVLVEGDPALLNVYHVIAVSPGKHPGVRHALAMQLADYLTSLKAQELISRFGREEYGQSLFFPDSDEWREGKR